MTTAVADTGTTDAGTKTTETTTTEKTATGTQTPEQIAAEKVTADAATAKAAADAETARPKAPEKYALTLPEGTTALFSPEEVTFLEEVARANNWTNEEAQAELNAAGTRALAKLESRATAFLAETQADKEYGGPKYEQTEKLARAAIDRIRPLGHPRRDGFLKFIEAGGSGKNIHVVSFLADIGKLMAEDAPRTASATGEASTKTLEERLYGSATGLRHAKE